MSVGVSRTLVPALLLVAVPALAGEPEVLPGVVIEADREDVPQDAPARRDPTGAVSVIRIDPTTASSRDAAELLAQAPGVLVQDSGGLGQRKTLTLRGASANGVLVFLDGVPLNGAGGLADLSLLPVALLERFEVLRGGAGARYGSGGLGGVVNAVTRPTGTGARATAELRYGSFDTLNATASLSGPLLGGQALVLLHGLRTDGDFTFGFDPQPRIDDNPLEPRTRENNAAQLGGTLVKYRRAAGEWTTDSLVELLLHQRGLAGTTYNPVPDAQERGGRGALAMRAWRRLGRGELSLRGHAKAERTELSGGWYPSGFSQWFQSAGLAADAGHPLGDSHLLTGSVELGFDRVRSAESAPSWFRAAALVMDEWLLLDGDLVVAPSLRADTVVGTRVLFSPKLGATWALPAGFELRANAGQSHRWPSMLELYVVQGTLLPNPNLRPERGLYADAGVFHRREWLDVGLTGFYGLYEDLIAYEFYPPFSARPYNFDVADVGGLEAEAAVRAGWVELDASYTLTGSRNLRDDPRFYLKELPYRPRHRAHARLSAGREALRGRVEADYQSARFMNRTQTLVLPARLLLDASVTARVPALPSLFATLEVKNLLDVQTQDFDGYPLPGRSVFFTLSTSIEPHP